jgi:hypothetical protein
MLMSEGLFSGLEGLDFVTQPRGRLEVFLSNSRLKITIQTLEFLNTGLSALHARRNLTAVSDVLVHGLEH